MLSAAIAVNTFKSLNSDKIEEAYILLHSYNKFIVIC